MKRLGDEQRERKRSGDSDRRRNDSLAAALRVDERKCHEERQQNRRLRLDQQ